MSIAAGHAMKAVIPRSLAVVATLSALGCTAPHPATASALKESAIDSDYLRADTTAATAFLQHWIAVELRGALEPPLTNDSLVFAETYRVMALGGWGGVHVIRVVRRDSDWLVVRTVTRADSEWTKPMRTLVVRDSTVVDSRAVSTLIGAIERGHDWRDSAPVCLHGVDGMELLLEARTPQGYRSILCWSPESKTAPTVVAAADAFFDLERRVLHPLKAVSP